MINECYLPLERVLKFSESLFVPVIRKWRSRHEKCYDPKVFQYYGRWFAIVQFRSREALVLHLTGDPR